MKTNDCISINNTIQVHHAGVVVVFLVIILNDQTKEETAKKKEKVTYQVKMGVIYLIIGLPLSLICSIKLSPHTT